jgi:multiple sugar transport system substrate-binding protein
MRSQPMAWPFAGLFVTLTLILAACGGAPATAPLPIASQTPSTAASSTGATTPQQPQGAIKVTVWTHGGTAEEVEALTQILEHFRVRRPDISVDLVYVPQDKYNAQVQAALYGVSIVGDLPCLLDFDGPYVANYAWRGILIPLDTYLSPEMKDDFLPSIIAQGTYQDGKLYSLGQFDTAMAIWGNKKYLEQAGVRLPTVAQPWSRAEFEEALAKLQALPEVEHALDMRMRTKTDEWYTYGFSPIVQSFGADLIDRTSYQRAGGVLNGPAAVAALEMVQGWFKQGYVNLTPATDDEFIRGKEALSWIGYWMKPQYQEALGDNLVLLPMPDFGHGPKTGMGTWNWGITNTCKNPDAAWEILRFLLEPEQILVMTNANGAVPARKSALAKSEEYSPGGLLHLYIEQIEAGFTVPRPITPAYPVITTAFAEAFKNIARGANVKAELDKAAQQIDQDIKDHNGYSVRK